MRAMCHAHLTLLDLITVILIGLYLAESTRYEAPDYAASSNLLSLHLSSVQIF
jgi:hypothetical protein